jgi:HPt (histidine-containing phosphotransfer) domain-containing protein
MNGILDQEMIGQLRAIGDDAFFAELIDLYASDSSARLAALRAAFAAGDAATLASEAHALKSSSGNVAATAARELSARVEAAGRAGDAQSAGGVLDQLELEVGRALEALRSLAGS